MSDGMNMPPAAAPKPSAKGLATASLVLGIIGAVFALFCPPVAIVLGLIGLPLGAVSFAKQSNGSAVLDSKGMAIAGIVLSIIAILGFFLVILGVAASFA